MSQHQTKFEISRWQTFDSSAKIWTGHLLGTLKSEGENVNLSESTKKYFVLQSSHKTLSDKHLMPITNNSNRKLKNEKNFKRFSKKNVCSRSVKLFFIFSK